MEHLWFKALSEPVDVALMISVYIWEVFGSYLGWDTGCTGRFFLGFSQFLLESAFFILSSSSFIARQITYSVVKQRSKVNKNLVCFHNQ